MPKCLGARQVVLNSSLDATATDTGSATIIVEVNENLDQDEIITVRLATQNASYICNISLSDASSLFENNIHFLDRKDRLMQLGYVILGRLSHREDELRASSIDLSQNLFVSIHTEDRSNSISDSREPTENIYLIIQQKVLNGMKRTILRIRMEKLDNIAYCVALGNTVNDLLKENSRLKTGIASWKQSAEDLGCLQQETKNILLRKFTLLRNLVQKRHQSELQELKEVHEREKVALAAASESHTESFSPKKTTMYAMKDFEKLNPVNDDKQLLGEDAFALAEGRRFSSNGRSSKSVLGPDEAIDMVKIFKEGQAFEGGKRKSQQKKRKERNDNE